MKRGKLNSKAQTTIFIIIAILIITITIIFIATKTNILKQKQQVSPEIQPIYSFVQECIKQTAENAIYHIGQTGGYNIVPENQEIIILDNETYLEIAHYLYNNENQMPSKQTIENEISLYIDNFVYFCINEFKDFQDFEINYQEMQTQTQIKDNKILFNINFPINISKAEKTYLINEFNNIEFNIRFDKIYNTAEKIMEKQMQNKNAICFSCLHDLAQEQDMEIYFSQATNNTFIFTIIDKQSKIYDNDYEFYFANKYDFQEESVI